MAKVSIPHVSWRDGRPRFEPSKTLRAAGYKGKDLRHGKDGAWYTEGEALDWSRSFAKSLAKARKDRTALAPAETKATAFYPVSRMFDEWLKSPRLQTKARATLRDYRQKSRVIENHDPELWASEVSALDQQICYGLYEDLWKARGQSTANGTLRVLSIAIKWAMRSGKVRDLKFNPARDLGMEQLQPRARFLTRKEFDALVKAAEDMERIDMADMFYCAIWTGQRQADRLKLPLAAFRNGRFVLRQQKTQAIVNPPIAPEYQRRLEAARRRRLKAGKAHDLAHINEVSWEPWLPDWYRHLFAEIRTEAAKKVPSVATVMEKDFRSTAVTWLALAKCTLPQICSITGHSLQTAHTILKHYLVLQPEMADTAIAALIEWYEAGSDTSAAIA